VSATKNLSVAAGDTVELKAGNHAYINVNIAGTLRTVPSISGGVVTNNKIQIRATKIVIEPSGIVDASAYADFENSLFGSGVALEDAIVLFFDGMELELIADSITVNGKLVADGLSDVNFYDAPDERSRDAGSISLATDNLAVNGTISASGADGLSETLSAQQIAYITDGSNAGVIDLQSPANLNFGVDAMLLANGGNGGDFIAVDTFICNQADGGNGGAIYLSPDASLDINQFSVQGGVGGSGIDPDINYPDGCPDGSNGAVGLIDGIL
jgi:hypothetical protein